MYYCFFGMSKKVMAFVSLYNSSTPEIRQTIVLDLNTTDPEGITQFENIINPPKPYFTYTYNKDYNLHELPRLRELCEFHNVKKSGNRNQLINRLLLNDLGIKQHSNEKFYQKIICKGSYISTSYSGPRYHKPIGDSLFQSFVENLPEDIKEDENKMMKNLNIYNLNYITGINESKINMTLPDDYEYIKQSRLLENPCPYLSLIWSSDKAVSSKIRDFENLDRVLIKYKVLVSDGNPNSDQPDEIKYNTFEGDVSVISNFLQKKNPISLHGKITFHNGNIYTGEIIQIDLSQLLRSLGRQGNYLFIPSGIGTMEYRNGSKFTGRWINGNRNNGKYTYGENSTRLSYEGHFSNNKFNGAGTIIYKSGDKYEGYFVKGKYQGKGIFICTNYTYHGDFFENDKHGTGHITYQDGTEYTGIWYRNMMDGSGKLTHTDGEVYEGEFYENQYQGKGRLKYSNGELYEGDFNESLFDGTGIYTYNNGNVFKGH